MNGQIGLYGEDLFNEIIEPPSRGKISDAFLVPPFTVLNARDGFWQNRKNRWKAMGIKGEIGRDGASIHCPTQGNYEESNVEYISVFDPVLCELAYLWFCPSGGQIVDPFAGGSVRGIVAASMGYNYWGCDLSESQIIENRKQVNEIIATNNKPQYVIGDALEETPRAPAADFIFSCPPYGDLEKYSDDTRDLSNMDYYAFVAALKRIVKRAVSRLKENSFACFVVGDFRDKRGFYRNFVSDTIAAFRQQAMQLYNEAILVTSVGSASMRVRKQFETSRKLAKTHQNVLVFVKGDPRIATQRINNERSKLV